MRVLVRSVPGTNHLLCVFASDGRGFGNNVALYAMHWDGAAWSAAELVAQQTGTFSSMSDYELRTSYDVHCAYQGTSPSSRAAAQAAGRRKKKLYCSHHFNAMQMSVIFSLLFSSCQALLRALF